jgi:transposase
MGVCMDSSCPRCQELEAQLIALQGRLSELERRFKLNSGNSSKPPGSDGLAKSARVSSLREAGRKPSGGQVGHKGGTLEQAASPDRVVEHRPPACSCGANLEGVAASSVEKRQVFDIPVPRLEVTEHQAVSVCCPHCFRQNTGAFPEAVSNAVQYGGRVKAVAVYLSNYQLIPEDRLQALFADISGMNIATATLAAMNAQAAAILAPVQEAVLENLKNAPVKHLDETGFRIAGKTQWLHVISNKLFTHYRVSPKRGDLLSGVSGIIVHDHWKPYFTLSGVTHALCNAHILRELKALAEIEKEAWARGMQRLMRLLARLERLPDATTVKKIIRLYDGIVAKGLAFHANQPPLSTRKNKRRIGHNLLLRLQNFKDAVLRFLTRDDVPFTNNQAEQDIRMMKVKQKISGSFRTQKGAEIFAIIRGFLSTKRKQGNSPFIELAALFA